MQPKWQSAVVGWYWWLVIIVNFCQAVLSIGSPDWPSAFFKKGDHVLTYFIINGQLASFQSALALFILMYIVRNMHTEHNCRIRGAHLKRKISFYVNIVGYCIVRMECLSLILIRLFIESKQDCNFLVIAPSSVHIVTKSTQIVKFKGPTWGPLGSCRPQMAPCLPHKHCYQGI